VALELLKEVEVDIEDRVTAPFLAASNMGGSSGYLPENQRVSPRKKDMPPRRAKASQRQEAPIAGS
jgi:hypothetical protein